APGRAGLRALAPGAPLDRRGGGAMGPREAAASAGARWTLRAPRGGVRRPSPGRDHLAAPRRGLALGPAAAADEGIHCRRDRPRPRLRGLGADRPVAAPGRTP